uniref:DDE-1 domain-containing protein n=1 Tax=Panagrellus redivivus TaxID=6233 RepID=A0A7E4V7G4_PANRE
MLSFAKTYKILPIVEALEVSLQVELSLDNFYPIVQHAWDFEMTELKSKCAHFYKENYNKRIFTEEFVNMNPKVQVDLNREAANINE